MPAQPQLYTIHYADGRVDGPISSLVVRDLIKAGVISDADQLSVGGDNPQPYGAYADFADLGAGGPPPPPQARSVKAASIPRRAAQKSGPVRVPRPVPRVSSATPVSGVNPVPRATATTPTSGARPLPRSAPSGAPPSAAPPPPTTRSRTKTAKFPDEWIEKGAENLRDRLLMATLPDILGVDIADLGETVSRAYVARAGQVGQAFAGSTNQDEQLAVADALNILLRAQEILTDASKKAAYVKANEQASRVLSFQNHCMDFQFATESALLNMPTVTAPPGDGASGGRTSNSSAGIRATRPSNPNLKARMAKSPSPDSSPRAAPQPPSQAAAPAPRRSILSGPDPVSDTTPSTPAVSGLPTIPGAAAEPVGLPSIPSMGVDAAAEQVSLGADAPSLDNLFSPDEAGAWGSGAEDLFSQADEAPTTVGPPPIDPMGFGPEQIVKGPEGLRDSLLMSSLPDVLGVGLDATPDTLTHAYVARSEQARALKKASSGKEDKLAALDVMNILLETHALMSDAARLKAYAEASENAGRMLSFQNHIPFSFATEVELAIANADEATPRAPKALQQPRKVVSLLSGTQTKARIQERPDEAVKYKDKQAMEAERQRQIAAEKRREEKKKRRREFGGAEVNEEGDPFKGRLAFGVGKTVRGLQQVAIGYILVFVVSFGLVSFGGFGADELALSPDDRMLYIRAGLMTMIGLGMVVLIRRENPLRLGLLPKWGVIIAIPAALGLAAVAGTIARFEIAQDNLDLWGSLAVLLAIRAVGEGIFFHGFITRTLLIEFKNPGAAVFLSAVLYGIYGATYASLVQGGAFGAMYACFIYAFGGGFPFAVMYWKTRSTPALILVHFIVLMGSAAGGVAYATKFAN